MPAHVSGSALPPAELALRERGLAAARRLVATRFAEDIEAAWLAGSVVRGTATPTSDLDVVVVVSQACAAAHDVPYRETLLHEGWLVELFVHDAETLVAAWERDRQAHRNTLADMCAHGWPLLPAAAGRELTQKAATFDAAGPRVSPEELVWRRYALGDALDDLQTCPDHDEQSAIAAQVLVMTAELALLSQMHWLGRGKWLARRLREMDPALAELLLAAHRSTQATSSATPLGTVAEEVLLASGGRVNAGFRSQGRR